MSTNICVLILGSNIGNSEKNIVDTLYEIENSVGKIKKKTKIIKTKPVEFVSSNIFCNIAIVLETVFSPFFLLKKLKEIEVKMGRISDTQVTKVYKDRIIDIDIVIYNNINFCSKKLTIPHEKHLLEREFSRKLLNEIL